MKSSEIKLKRKVYLAGPFFNDRQREVISKLEDLLDNHPMVTEVFSPSRDGVKLVIGESTFEERKSVFLANCYNIDDAAVVVAFADNNDQGTYWEIGRAKILGIPVIQLYDTPTDQVGTAGYLDFNSEDFDEALALLVLREVTRSLEVVVVLPSGSSESDVMTLSSELQKLREDYGSGSEYVKVVTIDEYLATKDHLNPAVLAFSIDDRDPKISEELGKIYASELKNRLVTFSQNEFGVNVMLQHSIVSHSIKIEDLWSEIVRLSNYDYKVDESHYKSTEEFE